MIRLPTPRWEFGVLVYKRANVEIAGIITGHLSRPGGMLMYLVSWGTDGGDETVHWETELLDEKPYNVPGAHE